MLLLFSTSWCHLTVRVCSFACAIVRLFLFFSFPFCFSFFFIIILVLCFWWCCETTVVAATAKRKARAITRYGFIYDHHIMWPMWIQVRAYQRPESLVLSHTYIHTHTYTAQTLLPFRSQYGFSYFLFINSQVLRERSFPFEMHIVQWDWCFVWSLIEPLWDSKAVNSFRIVYGY